MIYCTLTLLYLDNPIVSMVFEALQADKGFRKLVVWDLTVSSIQQIELQVVWYAEFTILIRLTRNCFGNEVWSIERPEKMDEPRKSEKAKYQFYSFGRLLHIFDEELVDMIG